VVKVWPETVELGPGVLAGLSDIAFSFGKNPLVITGPGRSGEICRKVFEPDFIVSGSSQEVVHEVTGLAGQKDVLAGIGGGKVVDVGKMAAHGAGLPFLSVPTILSGDGIASPIAVIDGVSQLVSVPTGLVCDLDVLASAPRRHTAAGAGDLLSNLSAAWDWRMAHERGMDEDYNGLAAAMSETGAVSLLSEEPDPESPDFLRTLAEGLLLSGAAMALAGSSKPSSGSEHKISHAMDRLFGGPGLHGEQVALAAVFTAYLQSNSHREHMVSFMRKLGLPTHPEDLGLSFADFARCVTEAPSTRPDRFTILEEGAPSGPPLLGLLGEAFGS
jgi:glycerol-1-phosphate dehydrogenase [NAD(P)+]